MAEAARSEPKKEAPLAEETDEREVHFGRKIPIRNLYHLLAYANV